MRLDRRSLITILGGTGTTLALAGCVTSEEDADGSGNDDNGNGDDGNRNGNGDGGGNGNGGNGNGNGSGNDGSDENASDEETIAADDPGSARLWHSFADAEADDLVDAIERFQDESGHELNHEELSELEEQLNTSLPVGEGPDTFSWAHDWIGPFENRDWLYGASEDLTVDIEETYIDTAGGAVTWNDEVYGLPFAAETVGLLYNRDLVDSAPETVEEMVSVMEEHHDPGSGTYGISYPLNDPYFVSAWIHAFDGFYYDAEADELGLERDETIEGLELLMDSFAAYAPEDPEYESQVAVFNDGNAPFAINGPWQVGGFRDAGIDVGVSPLPDVEGGSPSPYSGVQMWYFTSELEGNDDALRAARDFAEWYTTNEEILLDNAESHGYIPVHADVAESDELGEDTVAFAESVDMGIAMPTSPRMDQVWTPVEDALTRVLNGDQEPREAFEQAAEEVRNAWDGQEE